MTRHNASTCRPGQHIGAWRSCDICAAARQKKIANLAEKLASGHSGLTLTVLKPSTNDARATAALRASIVRSKIAPAGIWTIETGTRFKGLHINILSQPIDAGKIQKNVCYSELILSSVRDVAAYISKRAGAPSIEQYAGNTFGNWGTIGDKMRTNDKTPIIQAATLEYNINPKNDTQHLNLPHQLPTPTQQQAELSRAEFHEIARRHLSNLYLFTRESRHSTTRNTA